MNLHNPFKFKPIGLNSINSNNPIISNFNLTNLIDGSNDYIKNLG